MTIWKPDLDSYQGPRYRAIADALEEAIDAGRLEPGDRLPTHRELAKVLQVTVGTISRAYSEAENRGLVSGEVGRGTFVRAVAPEPVRFGDVSKEDPELIDLRSSVPAIPLHEEEGNALAEAFAGLARRPDLSAILGGQPYAGAQAHRQAGVAWLRRLGVEADARRILLCCGAQHAMAVVFSALTRPGEAIFTEELTFPGMKGLANLLHLRLLGLPMDSHGLRPEPFEEACRRGEARMLYTIPGHQNPTTRVTPEERRREIVAIARRYDVTLVEDDVYGFLIENRPRPYADLAPERTLHLSSLSKVTAPGMRVGFLAAPEPLVERLAAAVWASAWMAAPPLAEVTARWIEDGTIDRFMSWKRQEAAARNAIARSVFAPEQIEAQPCGYFLWLRLPEPWRGQDFLAETRRRGVALTPSEVFHTGRGNAPDAVRLSLVTERCHSRLREGLSLVAEILQQAPRPWVGLA